MGDYLIRCFIFYPIVLSSALNKALGDHNSSSISIFNNNRGRKKSLSYLNYHFFVTILRLTFNMLLMISTFNRDQWLNLLIIMKFGTSILFEKQKWVLIAYLLKGKWKYFSFSRSVFNDACFI